MDKQRGAVDRHWAIQMAQSTVGGPDPGDPAYDMDISVYIDWALAPHAKAFTVLCGHCGHQLLKFQKNGGHLSAEIAMDVHRGNVTDLDADSKRVAPQATTATKAGRTLRLNGAPEHLSSYKVICQRRKCRCPHYINRAKLIDRANAKLRIGVTRLIWGEGRYQQRMM